MSAKAKPGHCDAWAPVETERTRTSANEQRLAGALDGSSDSLNRAARSQAFRRNARLRLISRLMCGVVAAFVVNACPTSISSKDGVTTLHWSFAAAKESDSGGSDSGSGGGGGGGNSGGSDNSSSSSERGDGDSGRGRGRGRGRSGSSDRGDDRGSDDRGSDDRGGNSGRGGDGASGNDHGGSGGGSGNSGSGGSGSGKGGGSDSQGAAVMERSNRGVQVSYPDGSLVEIWDGVYENRDSKGRIVVHRDATAADYEFVEHQASNQIGTFSFRQAEAVSMVMTPGSLSVTFADDRTMSIEGDHLRMRNADGDTVMTREAVATDRSRLESVARTLHEQIVGAHLEDGVDRFSVGPDGISVTYSNRVEEQLVGARLVLRDPVGNTIVDRAAKPVDQVRLEALLTRR